MKRIKKIVTFLLVIGIVFFGTSYRATADTALSSLLDIEFVTNARSNGEYGSFTVPTSDFSGSYTETVYFDFVYMDTMYDATRVQVSDSTTDMSDTAISNWDAYYEWRIPTAVRLGSATVSYNCHFYAWFNHEMDDNPCWMQRDPLEYFSANLAEEVTTPAIGDIICYFDANGKNLHSGIVVEVSSGNSNGVCGNSNLVTVESKWGQAGLYRHRGDQCPYTRTYLPYNYATSVKYYRITHNREYASQHNSQYVFENYLRHSYGCTCGITHYTEEHDIYHNGRFYVCTYCNYRSSNSIEIMKVSNLGTFIN